MDGENPVEQAINQHQALDGGLETNNILEYLQKVRFVKSTKGILVYDNEESASKKDGQFDPALPDKWGPTKPCVYVGGDFNRSYNYNAENKLSWGIKDSAVMNAVCHDRTGNRKVARLGALEQTYPTADHPFLLVAHLERAKLRGQS